MYKIFFYCAFIRLLAYYPYALMQRIFGSTRVFVALHSSMLRLGRLATIISTSAILSQLYKENTLNQEN